MDVDFYWCFSIGVAVEIMGVPVLPVAIGLYLPFELSASILVGGILRYVSSRKKKDAEGGILFCSGLIAGEGLMGIVLALLAVFGKSDKIDLSHWMDTGIFGAAALVFVIAACILIFCKRERKSLRTDYARRSKLYRFISPIGALFVARKSLTISTSFSLSESSEVQA